mgnify:CR=1 FL=1
MSKIKVVHYINQFFAQIGGEEKADYPAEIRVGEVVGPGLALTQNFKDEAEIIATVICGDSYFNENLEKAKADILAMVKEQAPDVFIAGPAFNAGRYGVACGTIAAAVQEELGIPAVTGMYVENPGADMFKNDVYMISTKNSAAGMRDAVKKLAPLAVKLAKGEKIGAFGLTEPNAGSDAGGTETTAIDKGDHWLLNGGKIFITNAPKADTYVVFAVTTPVLLTDATAVLLDVHFTVPSAPFNTSVVFVPATMRLTVLFNPIVSAACAVRAVPNGRHSTDAESISAIRKTVRIWLFLPFLVSLFKKIPPPFFTDLRQCNQIPM